MNSRFLHLITMLLLFLVMVVQLGYSQTTTTQQQITLQAQPPIQVSTTTAQSNIQNGVLTYYYWVVANYPVGKALPFVPGVVRNTDTPSVGNPISIRWALVSGATSYDVIRSTTAQFPPTCANCAVATGLTTGVATDTNVGLGSYSTSGAASPQTGVIKLENALLPEPRFTSSLPLQSDKVCWTDGTCQTTAATGGGGGGTGLFFFVPASGSGTAYTGAVTDFTTYTDSTLIFKPDVTNTGAVTVNVNALGATAVINSDGNALTAGQIVAGGLYLIAYDGTSFQIVAGSTVAEGVGGGITITYSNGQAQFNTSNLVCLRTGACTYTGAWDASTSSRTSPFRIGAADPGTCISSVREFFYNTASNELKVCNVDDTWTVVTGGGGGTPNATLVYSETPNITLTGTGAAQTFFSDNIPANTFAVGDTIRIEWGIVATSVISSTPTFSVRLGNGGYPEFGITSTSQTYMANEYYVSNATTATITSVTGWRDGIVNIDTTGNGSATSDFDITAINTIGFRDTVALGAGETFRLAYFRVWRIRP